jgi:hypothetical protein
MPPQQPFQQPPYQQPIVPTQGTAGNPTLFPPGYPAQNSTFQQTMRLYQGARGSWAYLFGSNSGNQLGVNELDTTATFAVPFFMNSQANINHAPLLVTPGFGLQLWDGPNTASTGNDLPPSTYDVFLDGAWNPQFTPLFGAELGLRVGIFTNWDVFVTDSWRIMGRAIGTLNLTPTMQGKAGIIYLDRNPTPTAATTSSSPPRGRRVGSPTGATGRSGATSPANMAAAPGRSATPTRSVTASHPSTTTTSGSRWARK